MSTHYVPQQQDLEALRTQGDQLQGAEKESSCIMRMNDDQSGMLHETIAFVQYLPRHENSIKYLATERMDWKR
jgi:hypothetical protein